MANIVGDVTGLQKRHHPWNIPKKIKKIKKIKGFPLKAKSFQNTVTYQKLRVGFHPPPPPCYNGGGMNFACTSEV